MNAPRVASASDVPEVVRVINLAYRVEDFFVNGDRTHEAEIRDRMSLPGSTILVIDSEETGRIAAAVCLDVREKRGHFAMLSVDPAFQGKGLARVLMRAIEDRCRAAGCDAVDIEVVDLREELPPFYRAFGFLPAGTIPFNNPAKLTREAHLVRMSKPL